MIGSDVACTGSGLASATMTSAGFVAFSDGTRTDFQGQTAAEMRLAAKGSRLVVAAQVGDRRDTLQLVDNAGHRWDSGVTAYGVNCLAVRPHVLGWECTLVLGAGPSRAAGAFWGRVIVDDTLTPVSALSQTPIPIGATSQGFLGFDPAGAPIWTDVSRQSSFGGVPAALWSEADGWTIFQSRESIDRICAYEHATGRVYVVWTGHTEHAPRIAATPDGRVLAAINGYDIFIARESFVPWSPIALQDEPPASVPTIAPWPCRLSVFYDADREQAHPLDAGVSTVDDRYVFCTLGRDDVQRAGTDAAAAGKPLAAYVDGWDYPPALVPAIAGVEVMPTVMAYPYRAPDGTLESVAESIAKIRATVVALQAAGHARVALVLAGYRQITTLDPPAYNWPLQHVLDLAAAVADLARDRGVRDLLVFTWSRGGGLDGLVSRPELRALFAGLRAAAQPVPAPTPTPQPLPVPAPDPISEDDPMRTNPTDALTYSAVNDGLAPRAAGRAYTDGSLDAYRLLAEGTPLAVVLAGGSQPTQQPIPACPYVQWAATSRALLAARETAKKGTGYTDGVLDTFRRFGGERWPLEYIMSDIDDEELPARPWGLF